LSGIQQAARVTGSQEEITFGDAERPVALWHWRVLFGYRYLQRDAVMDGWTDSDFHLGGTNAKGYYTAAELGVAHNTYVRLKFWASDIIDGAGNVQGALVPYGDDTLQLDLSARF
jgi:hypothetical protein